MIRAALLRAAFGLSTPDAIQAATAMLGGADGFISNDAAFRCLKGFDVLVLDDLILGGGSGR
jgi:predicted nucleic acid-binding protein